MQHEGACGVFLAHVQHVFRCVCKGAPSTEGRGAKHSWRGGGRGCARMPGQACAWGGVGRCEPERGGRGTSLREWCAEVCGVVRWGSGRVARGSWGRAQKWEERGGGVSGGGGKYSGGQAACGRAGQRGLPRVGARAGQRAGGAGRASWHARPTGRQRRPLRTVPRRPGGLAHPPCAIGRAGRRGG